MTGFAGLRRQHAVALATFKRDGTPVATPVSLAVAGRTRIGPSKPSHTGTADDDGRRGRCAARGRNGEAMN